MFVVIDNSNREEIVFYTRFHKDKIWKKTVFKINKNVDLLLLFDNFLHKLKIKPSNLSGIGVLIGEGSFTATRIAVTLANVFAWTLNIPVVGISEINPLNFDKKFKQAKKGVLISAKYSGEPSIGKRKIKNYAF